MQQNWKFTKNRELKSMLESIEKDVKKSVLISGDWGKEYASGIVVIDNIKGEAEAHKKMRDVWYILSGTGKFNLGGKAENPESIRKGEWLADSSREAETLEIGPGDVIDIPPGIPHQVDAIGGRIKAFVIKSRF